MFDFINDFLILLSANTLSTTSVFVLICFAGFTSFITAALGIGGGLMLLAVMATIMPPAALIPVHGFVQLGSNANRAVMTFQHIDWQMILFFSMGALVGAVSASYVVVQLPVSVIQLMVASFILFLVWGPKLGSKKLTSIGQVTMGGLTTLLTMFVGATGPLVGAYIHRGSDDKFRATATFAACMTVQHILKLAVFAFVGFSLVSWLPLVAAMIVSGMLGTWMGLKVLNKLSARYFDKIFKGLITVLAIRLIWQALL